MKQTITGLIGLAVATMCLPALAEISGSGTPNAACASGQIGGATKRMPASGVQGVTLRLADEESENVYVAQTDSYGKYLFFGLCEGDYLLSIEAQSVPAGLALIDVSVGREDGDDDDDESYGADINDSWEIELDDDDEQILDNDFMFEGDLPMARCQLSVNAGCAIASLPTELYVCSKRVNELSMIWAGEQDVRVVAHNGKRDDAVVADLDFITSGDRVVVSGMVNPPDDVTWEIFAAGSDIKLGESKFRLACDDEEMDGPGDCGLPQGDGKDNKDDRINDWLLDGLVDAGGEIVCAEPAYAGVCEFEPVRADCDVVDKIHTMTFTYSGGACTASENHQPGKFECEGGINGNEPILVTPKDGVAFEVAPGEAFTVSKDGSDLEIDLSNGGGTQAMKIHTSCSKPLGAGDVFGGLTLGAINGQGVITPVAYRYKVTNSGGADAANVSVTGSATGEAAAGQAIPAQSAVTLFGFDWVGETSTNSVVVAGSDAVGDCSAGAVTTAVVDEIETCDIAELERELHDKEVRWKLTTDPKAPATVERVELSWSPEIAGKLKELLFDGDKFFDQDVLSDVFVIDGENIEGEIKKRRIKRGEQRTLKVKFEKEIEDEAHDVAITVHFEEGCSVTW